MQSPSDDQLPIHEDATPDQDGFAVAGAAADAAFGASGFTDEFNGEEASGGTAVLEAPRWTPPTQEAALDPELVAILCGDPLEDADDASEGDASNGDASDGSVDESAAASEAPDADAASDDLEETDADDDVANVDPAEFVRPAAALLFASPEALTTRRLADLLGTKPRVAAATLVTLGERLEVSDLPFVLREVSGGWRLFTDPAMSEVVQRLDSSRRTEKISPAGLETLSIIAYRQPVTKAEIEAIRGVQAGPMLRTLVDRGLVKVTGRADQPGSPLLYGTTADFLDRFGLASLDDLPRDGELARD